MSPEATPPLPYRAPWDISAEVAEWLLVQQVSDLTHRSRRGATRYEVLGISSILRAMIGDKHSVLNLARRRLSLPAPVFRFTPYAPEEIPGSQLMLGFARQSEFTAPTTEATLAGFQRAPAACHDGAPVSVLEVIKFFAQVQGGIHVGVPKLPFETLAHSVVGNLGIDVGRMWMRALIAIAQVTIFAAQPLVDAITADRPELAEGTWPARTD